MRYFTLITKYPREVRTTQGLSWINRSLPGYRIQEADDGEPNLLTLLKNSARRGALSLLSMALVIGCVQRATIPIVKLVFA